MYGKKEKTRNVKPSEAKNLKKPAAGDWQIGCLTIEKSLESNIKPVEKTNLNLKRMLKKPELRQLADWMLGEM